MADDGYGVCYNICGENMLCFHVSSKKNCSNTVNYFELHDSPNLSANLHVYLFKDSHRFGSHLREALLNIKEMFEAEFAEAEQKKLSN